MQREVLQHALAIRIAEAYAQKRKRAAERDQLSCLGVIRHLVRDAERSNCFTQLGGINEQIHHRHREVARSMEYREAQGRCQHDITSGDLSGAPQQHRPGDNRRCHEEHANGMEKPYSFQ